MVVVAILEGRIVLSQWRLPSNMAAITMEKVNNARPLFTLCLTKETPAPCVMLFVVNQPLKELVCVCVVSGSL